MTKIIKSEEEWKAQLSPEQYAVLRQRATEAPMIGKYVYEKRRGVYKCVACGQPLFSSKNKFDSDCGWPSFDQALPGTLDFLSDESHGMQRVEVVCHNCGSHLGHVFDDGPQETTGQRFCINSIAMELETDSK